MNFTAACPDRAPVKKGLELVISVSFCALQEIPQSYLLQRYVILKNGVREEAEEGNNN